MVLLAAGYWLLATDYWLLANGYHSSFVIRRFRRRVIGHSPRVPRAAFRYHVPLTRIIREGIILLL